MAVTTSRTGNGDTLTGPGTWDVLFDANDAECGLPMSVFWFLCPTAACKLRINGVHNHTVGEAATKFETVAAAQYVERGCRSSGFGTINKVECMPVAAGTPAVYWGPALT
jgi:hypothetical protein